MKALVISADGFEDMELFYPIYRLREDGWHVTLAAPKKDVITGKHGYTIQPSLTITEINPAGYDLLVIPGGKAPEEVRLNHYALDVVEHFFEKNKTVAAICHGAQVLISACVLEGRQATCWKGIKDDLITAGAKYTDTDVVVDGNLVTSRMPDDLPAFMRETLAAVSRTAQKKAA